jgi:hypothetical protein
MAISTFETLPQGGGRGAWPGAPVAGTDAASPMAAGVSGLVAAPRPHCRRDPGGVCCASRHGLCVPGRAATAERDL